MPAVLNLKKFNKRMNDAVKNSKITFKDFQGRFFQETALRILKRTRVDTGLARGNWMVTMDNPATETTDQVAGVRSQGAPLTESEWSRIRSVRVQLRTRAVGARVWIANNLPYIRKLDRMDAIVAVSSLSALEVVKRRIANHKL